jgi:phosphoserine phosphatase
MDSTMISAECIDELADFAGLKDRIAAITERAMQGELDFESALRERVGLLKDLPEAAITQCLDERIRPMPGARTLVSTLKSRGCHTVLVTGASIPLPIRSPHSSGLTAWSATAWKSPMAS